MIELSAEQEAFLLKHEISKSEILDGRGLDKKSRTAKAKVQSCRLILVNKPCSKGGHYFQTRSGHCPQCDSAKIAFQERHRARQTIYLAGSLEGSCKKVGVTKDILDRHKQMNGQRYGGYQDWAILFTVVTNDAGRVESAVLARLKEFMIHVTYFKDNKMQVAQEMFRASKSLVLNTLAESMRDLGVEFDQTSAKKSDAWSNFD